MIPIGSRDTQRARRTPCALPLRVADPSPSGELDGHSSACTASVEPIGKDVTLTVEGAMNRPPYQKDAGITDLLTMAQAIYREIGKTLEDVP